MVAETGLQWQDNGEPALLQVSIMFKVPALLLVLFSLYSWAACGRKPLKLRLPATTGP